MIQVSTDTTIDFQYLLFQKHYTSTNTPFFITNIILVLILHLTQTENTIATATKIVIIK